MATSYPPDRFDEIPDGLKRVGAHRAPPKRGSAWKRFAWAVIIVIVLVAVGVVGLFIASGRINLGAGSGTGSEPVASASSQPAAEIAINRDLTVTVLNGTETDGLADQVGDTLSVSGWKIGTRNNASDRSIQETVVYYSVSDDLGAALALAQEVGDAPTALSPSIAETGAQLMVVLGADFR